MKGVGPRRDEPLLDSVPRIDLVIWRRRWRRRRERLDRPVVMDAMDVKAQGAGGQRITGTNIVVVGEAVAAQRCGVRGGDEAEEEEE